MRMAKTPTLITPNASKDVEQREFIRAGNEKWYNQFGRQFCYFLQTEHTLTMRSSNSTSWHSLNQAENYVHTKACT